MSSEATLVPSDALHELCRRCLDGLGVPPPDATAVADALLYATLRGLDTHGLGRLPLYMRRVKSGSSGGTERMVELPGEGAMRRFDAAQALGPAAAIRAMERAVELGREHGIGLVSLGRATHFGAAGFYARRAARDGMIGLVTSNGARVVAPFGARQPFLGTNPLAIAAPLGRRGEFVLDMATSAGTQAGARQAMAEGRPLAPAVAIDHAGRPTTDPEAALAGSLLPLAGAKGSGLAFAIAILSCALGGAALDDELPSIYGEPDRPQNLGQLFVAVDPWRLADSRTVIARLEEFVDRLHRLPPAEGFERVRFPGEAGDALAQERLASGIPVEGGLIEAVATVCEECGLAGVAEEARRLGTPLKPE